MGRPFPLGREFAPGQRHQCGFVLDRGEDRFRVPPTPGRDKSAVGGTSEKSIWATKPAYPHGLPSRSVPAGHGTSTGKSGSPPGLLVPMPSPASSDGEKMSTHSLALARNRSKSALPPAESTMSERRSANEGRSTGNHLSFYTDCPELYLGIFPNRLSSTKGASAKHARSSNYSQYLFPPSRPLPRCDSAPCRHSRTPKT